jgi:hypothetical protein
VSFGDEIWPFLGEENKAVDIVEHFDGNFFQAMAAYQNDGRHIEPTLADARYQRRGSTL